MSALVTFETGEREVVELGATMCGRSLWRTDIHVAAVDEPLLEWVRETIVPRTVDNGSVHIEIRVGR